MPAHYLAHLSLQQQVDYVNTCQQRVAADVLALETSAAFPIVAGDHAYDLPADLVELRAVYNGTEPLLELTMPELLSGLSGVGPANWVGQQSYALVGRTLYLLPQPAEADSLTLIYARRATVFESDDDLELSGDEQEVLEELLDGYVTFDRGETEVGAAALDRYVVNAARLRIANRRRAGTVDRRPVITHDLYL